MQKFAQEVNTAPKPPPPDMQNKRKKLDLQGIEPWTTPKLILLKKN
jgi:hypothetical protein